MESLIPFYVAFALIEENDFETRLKGKKLEMSLNDCVVSQFYKLVEYMYSNDKDILNKE